MSWICRICIYVHTYVWNNIIIMFDFQVSSRHHSSSPRPKQPDPTARCDPKAHLHRDERLMETMMLKLECFYGPFSIENCWHNQRVSEFHPSLDPSPQGPQGYELHGRWGYCSHGMRRTMGFSPYNSHNSGYGAPFWHPELWWRTHQ